MEAMAKASDSGANISNASYGVLLYEKATGRRSGNVKGSEVDELRTGLREVRAVVIPRLMRNTRVPARLAQAEA